jgi:hypothetical protein
VVFPVGRKDIIHPIYCFSPHLPNFFIQKVANSIINALKDRSGISDQKTGKFWNFLSSVFKWKHLEMVQVSINHRLALGTIMQFREFFTELFQVKSCCKIWTSRKKTKQNKNPLDFELHN